MIKIKVSYEHEKELERIKDLMRIKGAKIKQSSTSQGKYKRAYIIIDDTGV